MFSLLGLASTVMAFLMFRLFLISPLYKAVAVAVNANMGASGKKVPKRLSF